MRIIIICILGIITFFSVMVNIIFVASAWSATTQNLLTDDFSDTSKWSGNNQSIRHGDNIIAFIDGGSVSSTISLDDHLLQSEINNGFTASLDAEVWFWSNVQNQTTSSTMTITGADGTTYEQTIVAEGICYTWNGCGYEDLGTNSIVVGSNTQSNFDITSTFSATAPGTTGHWASDLRLPSLTVEYNEFVLDLDLDLDIVEEFDLDIDIETFDIEGFTFTSVDPFVFEEVVFDIPVETYDLDTFTFEEVDVEIDSDYDEVEIPLESYEDDLPIPFYDEPVSFYDEPVEEEFDEPDFEQEEIYLVEDTEEVEELTVDEAVEDEPQVETVESDIIDDDQVEVVENDVEVEQDTVDIVIDHKQKEIVVVTNFDDVIKDQVTKIEGIISTQPQLFDQLNFYSTDDIYTDQFVYVDNREIYQTVYQVVDPVIEHELKVIDNQRKQQQLRSELKLLKWKN